MSDVKIYVREKPNLISPSNDLYEWSEVNDRRMATISFVDRVRLLFRPWRTVLAPKGSMCAIKTLSGDAIYRYKELDGNTYFIQPSPSPGFPGS